MNSDDDAILPGLTMDASGHVTVDRAMGVLLFDLAIELDGAVNAPIDIEHVLSALILAARAGKVDASTTLGIENTHLLEVLRGQLRELFDQHGDKLDGEP